MITDPELTLLRLTVDIYGKKLRDIAGIIIPKTDAKMQKMVDSKVSALRRDIVITWVETFRSEDTITEQRALIERIISRLILDAHQGKGPGGGAA